jgi:hypothetical protein
MSAAGMVENGLEHGTTEGFDKPPPSPEALLATK